jgi:streptogramin lyase
MSRLSSGLAVAAVALAVAAPAARADVTPQYFTLPATIDAVAGGLAVGPDGTVYFGGGNGFNQTPSIGKLDPALAVAGTSAGITGVVTLDAPGCCSSIFRDMSWSAKDNRLYWTRSDFLVGTLAPGDKVATAPLPAAPWGIAAAPDGGAWLAEYSASNVAPAWAGNRIAQVAPDLGLNELGNLAFQTGSLSSLRYDAKPKGITVAPDGTPWFAEADAGNPGYRIGHANGSVYTEYSGPCFGASPCSGSFTGEGITDVAMGKDNSVWYVNNISKAVGQLVPGGTMTEYRLNDMSPGLGAGSPKAITAAGDGSLWVAVFGSFGAPAANAIVHIVPGAAGVPGTATVYKLGAANSPLEVAPDASDNVWFTGTGGTGGGPIGVLRPTASGTPTPTPTATATATATATETPVTSGSSPPPSNPAPIRPTTTTLVASTVGTARVTDPRVEGTSVNTNQICVGPPEDKCSLVYLIQTHEYVTGFPNTNGLAFGKPKKVLTTIGKATVTTKGGQSKKVTIKLNSKGKKLLKKIKRFKATLTVTQSVNGAKPKQVLKKNLRFKK